MKSPKLPTMQTSTLATMGNSRHAQEARAHVQRLSGRTDGVLIVGPEGSGRESLARSIHAASARSHRPFVVLDGSHFTDSRFFESQVFGHLPGVFAGLKTSSLGLIQAANGGTLFLRGLDGLPLESQAKLVPALRDQKVVPLGGIEALAVDVRLIASTHAGFVANARGCTLHQDLFDLVSENLVEVSRLADRMEDLPALAAEIVREISERRKLPPRRFSSSATEWLGRYEWPGNLRELRGAIDGALSMGADEIDVRSLRRALKKLNVRTTTTVVRCTRPVRFTGFAALRGTGRPRCHA